MAKTDKANNLELTAKQFINRLEALRSPQAAKSHSHLASDHADKIMGVRMGHIFALAKEFIDTPLNEVEKLLESPIHEVRVGGVSIMDFQARSKKTSDERRKELFDLYIKRHDRINTWDLVDRSAPYVVGGYLFDQPRKILYKLAGSKNMPERRTAIVSTGYFIRQGDVEDTFKIAEILIYDEQDLIHKATGWMLREVGKRDEAALEGFLKRHAARMPRTMLRYAIERFPARTRRAYLSGEI